MKEAGLLRRLGGWLYDLLMVTAILMFAAALAMGVMSASIAAGIIDVTGYMDTSDYLATHPIAMYAYPLYLLSSIALFLGFFWCKGGQTLGMRAWRLKIVNDQGNNITVTQALIRMGASAFGLGNIVALIDPNNRSLQDHIADTHTIVLPKPAKTSDKPSKKASSKSETKQA